MKYQYEVYYEKTNKTENVSRKELINVLNQWCTKHIDYIDNLGYIDTTDEKMVNKVLRAITVGGCSLYCIVGLGSVRAKRIKD